MNIDGAAIGQFVDLPITAVKQRRLDFVAGSYIDA